MGCSNSTMHSAATPRATPMLQREKTGFVAFEIDLKNNKTKELNKDIDKILSRPLPPKRLLALEPINNGPKLTAEELERRMILAEEKRQRTIAKRTEFSRRGSLRRQSVSRESKTDTDITEKLNAAEELRNQRLMDIKDRERQRSDRVTRIRDEARRKKEGVDELDSEFRAVECRDSSDEDGSWSGSADKKQKLPPIGKTTLESGADSSGYSSRNISATQELNREPISKININEHNSSNTEYVSHATKKPTIHFQDDDNFFDDELTPESDSDFQDHDRSRRHQKHNATTQKMF